MGRYEGTLVAEWLPDGRKMELKKPFAFIDAAELRWAVPKKAQVDGASIPQILWSITGSPYTGKYRDASVVHDYYCSVHEHSWQATHRMFHEAMLVSGVTPKLAAIMYAAVRYAGPRWSDMDKHNTRIATEPRGRRHTIESDDGDRQLGGGHGMGGPGMGGMADFGEYGGEEENYTYDEPRNEPAPSWAPANVSEEGFARLKAEILAGPINLEEIDAKADNNPSAMMVLPSGLFEFTANPETFQPDKR